MNERTLRPLFVAIVIALVFFGPVIADAQQGATEPSGELAPIVVVAQRRAESLENVPIAVTAVTRAMLENASVTNIADLPDLVPGMVFQQGAGVLNVFMRGIGNPAQAIGNESSVAVYIDGVYYSRLPPALFDLNNVDRVEVLKGPQGTLFGRNADAGLIQIITRDPTQSPTLHLDAGYGNYDTFTGNLYGSTGFGEKIAGDIAVHWSNQGQGWGTNEFNGRQFNWTHDLAFRSKWLVTPTDQTKITAAFDYNKSSTTVGEYGGAQVSGSVHGNFLPPLNYAYPPLPFYDADFNGSDLADNESGGVSIKAEQNLGFADLVSISAFRRMTGTFNSDADFTPQNFFQAYLPYLIKQGSQELQLVSKPGGMLDWQVGAFYMYLNTRYSPYAAFTGPEFEILNGPPFNLPGSGSEFNIYSQETVGSYAAYTQETVHLPAETNLTAGLRYTEDRVKASGHNDLADSELGVDINTGDMASQKNFTRVTYRLAIDHHFSDDVMGYVSHSTGFKAGTYNLLPYSAPPVNPELLDATEIGVKAELFNHRLRLNAAAFYYKISDIQVQEFNGVAPFDVNAASAKSKGLDLDSQLIVTDRLTAHLAFTYLDAFYSSFPDAPIRIANPNPPYGNLAPGRFNAAGQTLPNAPKNTLAVGLDYRLPSPVGQWTLSTNYAYNSGYTFDPDGLTRNKSYGLLDARGTYIPPGSGHYRLSLWGKNLSGEKYYLSEVEEANQAGVLYAPGAPRTFGITISYDM